MLTVPECAGQRSEQEERRRERHIGDLVQELVEAQQPPELQLAGAPTAAKRDDRFRSIDAGVDDEVDQRKPPKARGDRQRDGQRQDRMAEDVNGEGQLPTGRSLLAMRDPIRLQQKIGDEMFQRERQNEGAETPERNGGANRRHRRIQGGTEDYKAQTILILRLILQMSCVGIGVSAS